MCFEVPILSEHDSWALFRENVGYEVNSLKLETIDGNVGYVVDSIELGTIATKLVKECAGLPLAIVTLGKALRNKPSVSVWADALRRLQKSIYQDLMPVVDSLIKLSYDFLSNEVQKKCFLFCSLFPEDYKINVKDELLVYVVGEKLLEDGVDCFDSLEETKGRLDSVVEDLISSSLLLRVYEEVGYTKMHDVIRDVAKMIAFKDEKFKHMADAVQTDLMKWPEKLESCKRLSLMRTKIRCDFPKRVEAPQLLTLILNECEGFSELPCDFFKEMKNLRNLDLSDTKITSLPSSLSFLVELVTLRLRRCYLLKNIPTVDIERFESRIERLREKKSMLKPEILDLKKSGEERFESRIERLREKMSKPGEEEERLPEEIRMFNLKKLEILDLYESGIERLPEEMGMLTNLKSLNLTKMGNLTNIPPKVISSMCQLEELYADSFQRWEIGETLGDEINANLSEVASLAKLTCMAIHIPYLESFSTNTLTHWVKLKTFRVYVTDCSNKVIWLLQTVKRFQRYLFLQIPSSISNSNEVIWFLRRADFVSLQDCNGLESVVQVDHTGGFKDNNLKCLEVRKCSKMKYLIEVEQQILEIPFSSLEILYFEDLDNLKSICNGNTLPNEFLRNLKDLEFSSCRRLSCLINWELQNLGNSCSIFSNLRRLSLYGCEEITYVLPMSVARNLNQLVDFSVVSCPKIKMIIEIDNGEDDGDNYILPRLERLSLYNLPALLSFGLPGLVFEWVLKKLILIKSGKSLPSRVTQQRFSKFEVFELDDTLIHLLEDPTIINNLEHRVDDRGSYYYKKEKAEE
ncbi:Disease resistance protein [Thalictrum thalictroides]|uniref:Disease resistance protein n=1 Tax=Thalictrum thalictroides TaxID=46969 RepID=A0A7J6W4D8_THATH|nr:Disease resistance protein [Thalictrum thalictroides]